MLGQSLWVGKGLTVDRWQLPSLADPQGKHMLGGCEHISNKV